MTARAGDSQSRERLPGRRGPARPIFAACVVASPLLVLVLLDAAILIQALLDPSSTCWLRPQVEAGGHVLYPFEIHLLFFVATLQFWAPILLLMAVLFWYLEWIRPHELLALAVLSALLVWAVGFEFGWMVELYRGQYLAAACG